MIGESIEHIIKLTVQNTLNGKKIPDLPKDIIETDSIGEVIEKLTILHIRTWMLEDLITQTKTDNEVGEIKRKLDICFKVKRPKYVEAINLMINNAITSNKSLNEDSVKHYNGYDNQ